MKVYYAAPKKEFVDYALEGGVDGVLCSVAFFGKGLPDNLVRAVKQKKIDVFLDSGGFSNIAKPGTVTIDFLVDYIKSHKGAIREYATLDDLRSRSATGRNTEALLKAGLDPLYVDHFFRPVGGVLSRWYESGKKLCWGGLVKGADGTRTSSGKAIGARYERRVGLARAGKTTYVHLFGVGGGRLYKWLPVLDLVDSIDSSSWQSGAAMFGDIVWVVVGENGWPAMKSAHHRAVPAEMKEKVGERDLKDRATRVLWCLKEHKKFYRLFEARLAKARKAKEDLLNVRKSMLAPQPAPEPWRPGMWRGVEMAAKAVATTADGGLRSDDQGAPPEPEIPDLTALSGMGAEALRAVDRELHELWAADVEAESATDADDETTPEDKVVRAHLAVLARMAEAGVQHSPPEDGLDQATLQASPEAFGKVAMADDAIKVQWTGAYVNDLPDSAFLYIEEGGKKDGEGKTVPRTLRHFPVYDGKGKLDLPHLRNAIARIPQSEVAGLDADAKAKLQDKAREMLAEEARRQEQANKASDSVLVKVRLDSPLSPLAKAAVDAAIARVVGAPVAVVYTEPELLQARITKAEEGPGDEHYVEGVVLEPTDLEGGWDPDAQQEVYSADDVRKAMLTWAEAGMNMKVQHSVPIPEGAVKVLESWQTRAPFRSGDQDIKVGTWMLSLRVVDSTLWSAIRSGAVTGFSIGGTARRTGV